MKKLIIPAIVIMILSLFVACGGAGDEITYTGPYLENSSSNNSSSSPTVSGLMNSDSASDTVTVPLTTNPGETVPPIETTEYTTAPGTMNYQPVDVDTTVPDTSITFVPPDNTTIPIDPNTVSPPTQGTTKKPVTTEKPTSAQTKYVSVSAGETIISFNGTDELILYVPADNFGDSIKANKGNGTVNINGTAYKAPYKVSDSLSPDGEVVVTFDVSDLSFNDGDSVSAYVPKGAIVSSSNKANNAISSISTVY